MNSSPNTGHNSGLNSGYSSSFNPQAAGIPPQLYTFEPTFQAALQRVADISPSHYARTRNAVDGAVTGLSPYLTHGIISLPEVAALVAHLHRLGYADKLLFEFAWREFFHHVWEHGAQPDDILQDMRPAKLWRGAYARQLPADIREGRTGVPCIDTAVRQLYAMGYLHNHARMWLASYCVHLRKVHWRAGADWLYAHLLDGDLASNHLSWQWVAGTFSSKPYLFNASNVAKFAPQAAWKAWVSAKTVVDADYEQLDHMAREQGDVGAEPGVHSACADPALQSQFGAEFFKNFEPLAYIQSMNIAIEIIANKLCQLPAQSRIEMVTPWALSERGAASSGAGGVATLRIGLILTDAHTRLPWSMRRWEFVLHRMAQVCDVVWVGKAANLAALTALPDWPGKAQVHATTTLMDGYRQALASIATLRPVPKLLAQPSSFCGSFSKFYERAQREQPDFKALLPLSGQIGLL